MVSYTRLLSLAIAAALIAALIPLHTPPTTAQSDASDTRPLEGRALENVIAFTRLVGYVQYFYPGDEAAAADWNRFTVEGMRAVEDAPDADALIAVLQERFAPVAPLVQIYPAGEMPDPLPAPENTADLHLVAWYHLGLQTPESFVYANGQTFYTSTRLTMRPDGPPPPDFPDFPAPGTVYSADIGGGVGVTVPLVLWADNEGTIPHTDFVAEEHWPVTMWSADVRGTRLAGIGLAWNVIQHSWPYFDVVDVDWSGVLSDALQRAATDTGHDDYVLTLRWMMAQLHDGHTFVPTADTGYDAPRQLLPFAWDWIEDQAVITYVFPQAESVLYPGDVVRQMDGVPIDNVIAAEEVYVGAATPQFKRYIALENLLHAAPDQPVTLTIQHLDETPHDIVVTASVTPEDYAAALQSYVLFEPRPADPLAELEPGIWYLDITRTPKTRLVVAIGDMLGAHGLILDLRGYPHPERMFVTELLQLLADDPCSYIRVSRPQIMRPDQKGITFIAPPESGLQFDTDRRPVVAEQVVVLTNELALSQAETFLLVLDHCSDATIIGGPSAGTNGDVNQLRLPGGYGVMWTGAQVTNYDGSQFHGIGVLPDVPVARTRQGVIDGRDEVLEAALGILRE